MTARVSSDIARAAEIISRSRHMVALTGAGISTPSGIPDFRSPRSGLWENVDPYEVASFAGFMRRPAAYYEWVRPLARLIRDAAPNPAHLALADLERRGILKAILTQNIDGLHQRAGSRTVLELHGSHSQATCLRCLRIVASHDYMDRVIETGEVPLCECGGVLKPNVVLFREMLPVQTWERADSEARACDVMLVGGTSLEVVPASSLPDLAARRGASLIIVNRTPTAQDRSAAVVIHDDVAAVLPAIVAALPSSAAAQQPEAVSWR